MAPFFTGISRGVGGAGFGKAAAITTSAPILGSLSDPFTSTTQITRSGVYYFKAPGYLAFKTYCLYDVAGKNWIMAYNIHNLNATDLNYSSSYWSSRGELNVSDGNLDPTTGSTNVATLAVDQFPNKNLLITYRANKGNYSTYYLGSASDSTTRLVTARTSPGNGYTMTRTGTVNYDLVYDVGSSSTSLPGGPYRQNEWYWSAAQGPGYTQSSGYSYSRFGQVNAAELYGGGYFSNYTRGIGLYATVCGYSFSSSGGYGNARHSGGGCGDSPSATLYSNETFEVWFSE
jgi:hypothetical protein